MNDIPKPEKICRRAPIDKVPKKRDESAAEKAYTGMTMGFAYLGVALLYPIVAFFELFESKKKKRNHDDDPWQTSGW